MNQLQALLREDLRDFAGYRSARSDALEGLVWLNANESPWPNSADSNGAVRRYPDPQPQTLRTELAALYGCAPGQLLIGVRSATRPHAGQGVIELYSLARSAEGSVAR